MLPGIVGISGSLPSIGYIQTDTRTTAATSFSNVSFGPEIGPNRWVVLKVWHLNTVANPGQAPTATIGGVSANRINAHSTGNGSGLAVGTALFTAQPVGPTGTVSVSWGGLNVIISVFCVYGYTLSSAISSGGIGTAGSSISLNVPSQGLVIGQVGSNFASGTTTWTNLTKRADETVAGIERSWGWDFPVAANGSLSVSYTPYSSGQGQNALVAASFALS